MTRERPRGREGGEEERNGKNSCLIAFYLSGDLAVFPTIGFYNIAMYSYN